MILILALVGLGTIAASPQNSYLVTGYPTSNIQEYLEKLKFSGIPASYTKPTFDEVPVLVPYYSEDGLPLSDYISMLKEFDDASNEFKRHLTVNIPDLMSDAESNIFVQYVMILDTVEQLVEESAKNIPYATVYAPIVNQIMLRAARDPLGAANSINTKIDGANGQIALLRDFIRQKQQTACIDLNSYECNLIIDKAMKETTDPQLQHQIVLLTSLSPWSKLFNQQYAREFDMVSNSNEARSYLINGANRLKPFVEAGADARRLWSLLTLDKNDRSNQSRH